MNRGKETMNVPEALTPENTVLVVIDIQEKILRAMHDKEKLLQNLLKLIKGARVLEVPVLLTEQYPAGLGPTLPEVAQLLPGVKAVDKTCFSGCGEGRFREALEASGRRQVLLAGIEAHVCVYQTAVDLIRAGYGVHLVVDCISSREAENKAVTVTKLNGAGAALTTAEMALFELLKVAKGDKFKQISSIVK
jgi:nicotinamidase-related amidase